MIGGLLSILFIGAAVYNWQFAFVFPTFYITLIVMFSLWIGEFLFFPRTED